MRGFVLVLLVVLGGCHLQPRTRHVREFGLEEYHPPPATWAECSKYDRDVVGWTATGVVLGVLGGGSGVTTAFFDQNTPRYITGSISVTFGALTALASYLGSTASKKYADRCTQNEGGR